MSLAIKLTEPPSEGSWTCDRRLCLTAERDRVVPENTVEAKTLWATPGDVVSLAEAIRLGAVVPAPVEVDQPEEPAPAEPEGDAPEDEKPKPAAKRAATKDS